MGKIERELLRNKRIRDKLVSLREGLGFPICEKKIYLLTGYFSIAIEHHAAIDLLIEENYHGSGFAPLR